MSDDPKEIYLQPACCAGYEGREWGDHGHAWECEEGVAATKYIRADLYESLHPASEWKEADGPVLWWVVESVDGSIHGPYARSSWVTHWSPIPKVELPGEGA